MSKTHELKTDPEVFDASFWGIRDYEIRFDDRGFKVGDKLLLRETEFSGEEMKAGKPLRFTGREMTRTVCHILTGYGLEKGWVILACNPKEQVADLRRKLEQAQAHIKKLEHGHKSWEGMSDATYRAGMTNILNKTHDQALAEIEARAVEKAVDKCAWYGDRVWMKVDDLKEYAKQLRQQAGSGKND